VIKLLQPADALAVTRLDRLARSTRDLLNVLEAVKETGSGFRSLKDAWCDTSTPHRVLMLTILGDLEWRRSTPKVDEVLHEGTLEICLDRRFEALHNFCRVRLHNFDWCSRRHNRKR
jgi:hypothetical protein